MEQYWKRETKSIKKSYKICVTKMGWLITRDSKHVKATPITSEQCSWDQLSKDRKTVMVEDIIRQFENQTQHDTHWRFTEARLDSQTATIKTSTQYTNGTGTTSNCTVNSNTTNAPQYDIVVDNKENNCQIMQSSKKGGQQKRHKTEEHCDTNIQTCYGRKAKKPN